MSSGRGPEHADLDPDAGAPPGDGDRLVCGASSDDLLTQVAEGRGAERDAHQRDCVHCQAALGEYGRLWGPMRELADVPVHAPADLLSATLGELRARTAPEGQGRVDDGGEAFHVAARAVVTVAGHVARGTEGVRIALSGLGALTGAERTSVARMGIRGQSVAIELTVAADYGQDLHRLADRLRAQVSGAVRAQLGLDAVEIGVEITDVFLPRR